MSKSNRLLYFLALLRVVIPYLLQNPAYGPHRDEFLYLAEGHHLAFGFVEVPPMLSVCAWLTHFLGDSMFMIKLWPSLFGAATFIVAGKIIQSLGGKSFALFLLFLTLLSGVYLRIFFLFQPNPPEVFFVTLLFYALVRFFQTDGNRWLYVAGVSVGLGMLSKYSVAIFAISIMGGLVFSKERRIYANKHFWSSAAIGLIIFFPTILWEFNHHLPFIHHMKELKERQLQYVSPAGFLADQILMNVSCLFVWFSGLWFLVVNKTGRQYRFVATAFISVILLLIVFHGKNYYSLASYPVLFAFGSYWLEQATVSRFKIGRYVMISIIIILGIIIVPIQLPVFEPGKLAAFYNTMNTKKVGALKWEDHEDHELPQDFADMLGWQEMAQKVSATYETLDSSEKKNTILFCDNYGQAGALSFYADKFHLPYSYSDNGSFLYWLPDTMHIQNLLLITDDKQEMSHPFIKHFASAILSDSITNKYAVEKGSLIILLKGANEEFNKMFKEKIEKDKLSFIQ